MDGGDAINLYFFFKLFLFNWTLYLLSCIYRFAEVIHFVSMLALLYCTCIHMTLILISVWYFLTWLQKNIFIYFVEDGGWCRSVYSHLTFPCMHKTFKLGLFFWKLSIIYISTKQYDAYRHELNVWIIAAFVVKVDDFCKVLVLKVTNMSGRLGPRNKMK